MVTRTSCSRGFPCVDCLPSCCAWAMIAFSPDGDNHPLGLLWVHKQGLLPVVERSVYSGHRLSCRWGWLSPWLTAACLSALVAGPSKGRTCSLYSQLRGSAAGTVGAMVCGLSPPFLRGGVTLERQWSQLGLPTRCGGARLAIEACLLTQPAWKGQVPREHCGRPGVLDQNKWRVLALLLTSHWLSRLEEGKRDGTWKHFCSRRSILPVPMLWWILVLFSKSSMYTPGAFPTIAFMVCLWWVISYAGSLG